MVRWEMVKMLTYSFENKNNDTLYEYLYKQIKNDILAHKLVPNEKLPSKRALAKHLNISTITIENAYSQLLAEGYIYSIPKSGFYVNDITITQKPQHRAKDKLLIPAKHENDVFVDFTNNSTAKDSFPFATWAKLLRQVMSDHKEELMVRSPFSGIELLKKAIADHLYQFRGMNVDAEQIIIGAGTEYLYSLIIQLLGRDKKYAIEDPGYPKITKIYQANQVTCIHIPIDDRGIDIESLAQSDANIIHISPSHHFPTGIVTPISRRYELLSWAAKSNDRFIIEDDYDSEFRFIGKPIPTLQSIDIADKVIYINTFSKTLSSTIRISYMILPRSLVSICQQKLGFYACTVSNFEQYTLYKFIDEGYYEKHINRMRNHYRLQRDIILNCIKKHPNYDKVKIKEENSGLHFLLEVDTDLSDEQLINNAKKHGIIISCLSQYSYLNHNASTHTIFINYSAINHDDICEAVDRLFRCLW